MDDQYQNLLDDATAGLKDDPELRLDVRAELASHLAAAAALYAAEGHDAAASADLAAKDFGSPVEVAGELLAANKGRMKWRALTRVVLAAILVPLALLLAVFLAYGRIARSQATLATVNGLTGSAPIAFPSLPWFKNDEHGARWKKASELNTVLGGHPSTLSRLRAFWEQHRDEPGSNIYFAYYASHLFPNSQDPQPFIDEMRWGERIDPGNALYNFRLAEYYLSKGIEAKADQAVKDRTLAKDKVLDRRMIELGIAEYLIAARKPYYRDHNIDILQKKLAMLPTPKLTEDYLQNIAMGASELFPVFAKQRATARKIPGCARVLIAEGRTKEAAALLETWKPITIQQTRDAGTLIHLLVINACAAIVATEAAEIYDDLGQHALAAQTRREISDLRAVVKKHKKYGSTPAEGVALKRHGCALAAILFPVFSTVPTVKELAPSRYHEHVLAEEVALNGLLLLFALAMIGALLQSLIWYRRTRLAKSAPLLLLPPAAALARVLGLGVLLPLGVYYLYSRSPLGGWEYSFAYLWPRFASELLLLCGVLFFLPAVLAGRLVRRRCERLGVPTPSRSEEARQRMALIGMILLCIGLLALGNWAIASMQGDLIVLLILAALIIALLFLGVLLYRQWRARAPYALYHGTVARSLAPVYALAVILLAGITQPYLLHSEMKWLRQDTVVFAEPGESKGMTIIEDRAVERLRGLMLQAAATWKMEE